MRGGSSSSALADVYPTVLAFEDMQWADSSLLDFIEYLLEWSRNHPIFVITLARPELTERRPTWGAGHRNFTSLYLEPLSESAMQELLAGLVPGLPSALARPDPRPRGGDPALRGRDRPHAARPRPARRGRRRRIASSARSSRSRSRRRCRRSRAARLDTLSPGDRRIVQDAAVLGKTFTLAALSAVTGLERDELEPALAGLVRKELLGLQVDPRSPEHGQYGFLQDLIRQVAYDTLAKRDRRAKHLAAAEHLAASVTEEEVAEVVASHLVEAYRLDPDGADAPELRDRARRAMLIGAERAAALGAAGEAARFFAQAAELTAAPGEEAAALTRAGRDAAPDRPGGRSPRGIRACTCHLRRSRRDARGRPRRGLARVRRVDPRAHRGGRRDHGRGLPGGEGRRARCRHGAPAQPTRADLRVHG